MSSATLTVPGVKPQRKPDEKVKGGWVHFMVIYMMGRIYKEHSYVYGFVSRKWFPKFLLAKMSLQKYLEEIKHFCIKQYFSKITYVHALLLLIPFDQDPRLLMKAEQVFSRLKTMFEKLAAQPASSTSKADDDVCHQFLLDNVSLLEQGCFEKGIIFSQTQYLKLV